MQGSADIVPLDEERTRRAGDAPALADAGAMLRAAREEAGLSLDRVAEEINVKRERLVAIEAMDVASLPSAPYTMGFVRSYADHLGLPVEPLVARYREEAGFARSATAPVVVPPPRDLSQGRELHVLLILAVVGFVLWCAWQILQAVAPEEAALPAGYPIADRTEVESVEYEVATSLEEELEMRPPALVEGAAEEATEATPAEPPDTAPVSPQTAQVQPPADTAPRVARAPDAPPSLLPRVLVPPTAGQPDGTPVAQADPSAADVPPAAPDRAPADLNERLLLETMAGSAPSRSADVPENGPITARAAPGAREQSSATPSAPLPIDARPARVPPVAVPSPAPTPPPAIADETPARLILTVPPVYPTRCESRAARQETVTVRFNVSRFGRVVSPAVQETSNSCFDRAALSAVSRFGFEPATRDGRAVPENARTTRVVFRKP